MYPIRICELITELGLAGAERVVYELATRLDKRLFDVQVVALRGGVVADMLRKAGVRVTVLGVRGKWDFLRFSALTDVLRREEIDIVHTHLFHADLAGRPAARLAAVPHVVHTVHVAEERFRPWQYAFARFLGGYCDRMVCVSQTVLEHHARHSGLPRSKYMVIRNGVDAPAFARDEQARARLRAKWGLADKQPLIAFVGRLNPQKGVETLVSAMAQLAARGNPHELVIVGDGPLRGLVENYVAHGEGGTHARFIGFSANVREVYSAADIVVAPSRWEGCAPLVALETMAAGLPLIATRIPTITEFIADGKTALLFDREDSMGLAELIVQLARDEALRRRLGEAGRGQVLAEHTIQANIAAHQKLYLEVAGAADDRE